MEIIKNVRQGSGELKIEQERNFQKAGNWKPPDKKSVTRIIWPAKPVTTFVLYKIFPVYIFVLEN